MVLESSQSSEGWFQVLWSSDTEMSHNPVGLLRRRTKIVFKMNLWTSSDFKECRKNTCYKKNSV